ncbi:MAG: GTP-binding protein [Promethearchaeota archaeon]|nr:MAG: GTP-binding protein [Candidatus Lokiarchaeota archaeon]
MAEEYDYLFKSIVVGDGGVGKTALTLRFSKGFFTEDYKMTIGVDFHVKTITIDTLEGPIRSKLQIWDTGGQERFSSIRPMYYRGSLGALLIFDLTNSASFEHLPQWIEEVRANVKSEIPLLLVGNKSDLIDQRVVSLEEVNNFTDNFNLYYMETSAKTGDGVGDCFYILACLMIGSGVPDQLISKGIVFSPGNVPITAPGAYPTPIQQPEPEFDYAAPPVPEPATFQTYQPSSALETEPEFEFEAPPIPEPVIEPEFEPEIPLPEPSEKQVELTFKKPEEILLDNVPTQPMQFLARDDTYKPKSIPFTNNVPIPAPAPKGFQSPQDTSSVDTIPSSVAQFQIPKDAPETKSDSLMDYLPEPLYSKKDKKKLEKQKKKEEKEKKLQEEKEKQEKLLEEMKRVKKEKKEKPKKEKKEKVEKIETKPVVSIPTSPTTEATPPPSLFQALTKKTYETEKISSDAFIPFAAKPKSEIEEQSKLRIIPNVSDIESKPITFTQEQSPPSTQPKVIKPSGKEIVICKLCGAILSSDYAFCNKCGTKL